MAAESWLSGNGNGGEVDVVELLGDTVAGKAIGELVQTGALVSIGTTRDGGALGITVTVDGEWRRDYFRNREEMLAWFAEAIPGIQALTGDSRPSAAPRARKRRS